MARRAALCLLLALVGVASAIVSPISVIPHKFLPHQYGPVDAMPEANPGDVLDVFFLEGVVSLFRDEKFIFADLRVFHSGLGFHNRNSGLNSTYEFYQDGGPEDLLEAVFPAVIHDPHELGKCTLKWNNHCLVGAINFIDMPVWYKGFHVPVATINGTQYNAFLAWARTFNTTSSIVYDLWTIVNTQKNNELILPEHTCYDFVYQGLLYFHNSLGVKFNPSAQMSKVFVIETAVAATQVDFNDPRHHSSICKYYDTFSACKNESDWSKVLEIVEEVIGLQSKYVYTKEKYYHLDMVSPYIDYCYQKCALPGTPGNTNPSMYTCETNEKACLWYCTKHPLQCLLPHAYLQ